MSRAITIFGGVAVGTLLAWGYLAWVRASARRAARTGPAWTLLLGEGMARVILAAALFAMLARRGPVPLLAALTAFVAVRALLLHRWSRLGDDEAAGSERGVPCN